MIVLADVLRLHELSILKYGGGEGIRDIFMFESAIARPYQTFGGEDLYPDSFSKAAALGESLIINHPFTDGNKRTGFLAMFALLQMEGIQLTASEAEAYQFTIDISTGAVRFEAMVSFLQNHSEPLK